MLSRSPFLDVVGVARDGAEALEMVEELRPDVVTLDLNMPGTDGLSFLRQQMAKRPVPVLIVSIASRSGGQVLEALEAGAVDVMQKPTALATEKVLEMADELVAKVKAAAGARLNFQTLRPPAKELPARAFVARTTSVDVVVLGISTGGPQALKYLIPQLPQIFRSLLIVLHMPIRIHRALRPQSRGCLPTCMLPGQGGRGHSIRGSIARAAGYHLTLSRRADGEVVTHLDLKPTDLTHRPAADVLFHSAADVYGSLQGSSRLGWARTRNPRRCLDKGPGRTIRRAENRVFWHAACSS